MIVRYKNVFSFFSDCISSIYIISINITIKNAFMDTSGSFVGISNFSKYIENPTLIASFKNSILYLQFHP